MKTVILLRHADIDPHPGAGAPDNWPLNAAGQARASQLLHVVGSAGVTAILTSPALRTQQTADPVAAALGLQPGVAATAAQLKQHILSTQTGDVVLVVGHTNTVPQAVADLGAAFPGPAIQGHDDLYVVTVVGPGSAHALHLKYGKPSP